MRQNSTVCFRFSPPHYEIFDAYYISGSGKLLRLLVTAIDSSGPGIQSPRFDGKLSGGGELFRFANPGAASDPAHPSK